MSAYTFIERDTIICPRPCKVYSVIVYNVGADEGKVALYDGTDSSSGRFITHLTCPAKRTEQYRFNGLECQRGLFVDFVEKAEEVMVEWEPIPSKHRVEHPVSPEEGETV